MVQRSQSHPAILNTQGAFRAFGGWGWRSGMVCVLFLVSFSLGLADDTTPGDTAVETGAGIGQTIENFSLRDFRGVVHELADDPDVRVVVVIFLGTECPLARLYAPRIEELWQRYVSDGVRVLGVCSNRQDSVTELEHFARKFELTFPLLKDPGNEVADYFGAERTPEAFVLDRNRVVRYRGRIDDRYGIQGVMGYQRDKATSEELVAAIDDLLVGRDVGQPSTPAVGCLIGREPEVEPHGDVTWSNQISRLFQEHCQTCHRPDDIAPFPLLSYEDVQGWEYMIREVVEQERMPPWGADPQHGEFLNDPSLSAEEKQQLFTWIDNGMPEGDPADLPPPREFVTDWHLPKEPDRVIYMSDEPFTVPAEGVVEYQWFYVDPGFEEDVWVAAAECRPGNRAVVHHVTVYYKPPGGSWDLRLGDQINLLCGYAPGKMPVTADFAEACFLLPAGTQLAFEMHYTPDGTVQQDRSYIGLVFAEPEAVKRRVTCVMVANTDFAIPPHAENFAVESNYTMPEDALLYCLSPHMHLRGKSFRFEAAYPDGAKEVLLDVPLFDFNWQNNYLLRTPKRLPRGTEIRCVAHFDNSAGNLANPDPSKTVRWGDQTWEEMMIGTMVIAPLSGPVPWYAKMNGRWGWLACVVLGAATVVLGGLVFRRRRDAQSVSNHAALPSTSEAV